MTITNTIVRDAMHIEKHTADESVSQGTLSPSTGGNMKWMLQEMDMQFSLAS